MITIKVKTTGEKKSISVEGHAGYEDKGKDIVCASVSTIFQLAIMGLEKLANQYPQYIKVMEERE